MPTPARALRTAFAALYWGFVVLLVGSLGVSVIGRQVRLFSAPEGVRTETETETDPERCRADVEGLARDLDGATEAALAQNREDGDGFSLFRQRARAWESRWRWTRHACGLAEPAAGDAAAAALAEATETLLDHRYEMESFVRRHADREGPTRERIDALLARARSLGGAQ